MIRGPVSGVNLSRRFPAPALARAWRPKSGLRQAVTPAGESPGLAVTRPKAVRPGPDGASRARMGCAWLSPRRVSPSVVLP